MFATSSCNVFFYTTMIILREFCNDQIPCVQSFTLSSTFTLIGLIFPSVHKVTVSALYCSSILWMHINNPHSKSNEMTSDLCKSCLVCNCPCWCPNSLLLLLLAHVLLLCLIAALARSAERCLSLIPLGKMLTRVHCLHTGVHTLQPHAASQATPQLPHFDWFFTNL